MLFCVKTYKSNCYIAQLFLDQSPIVQLDVVVRSEFPDGQQKMAFSSHLSSLVHKRCGNTKSPRSLLNTGSAGFCTHGGQIVVTVVGIAEEKRLLGIKKGSQQIYNIPVQGSIIHVAYGKLYLVSFSFPSAKHATKRIICLSFLSYGLCVSTSFRR